MPGGVAFGAYSVSKPSKNFSKRRGKSMKSFWARAGPRGFDPFIYKNPLPVPGVMAVSTYVESSRLVQISVSANAHAYLLLSFTMTDIRFWSVSGTTITEYTMPNLTSSAAREVRPARLAMQLSNTTQSDQIGGYIRAVNMSDPLAIEFVNGSGSSLTSNSTLYMADVLSRDGRVQQFTGQQAAIKPLRFVCKPTNLQKFIEHSQYGNHVSGSENSEWNFGQLEGGVSTYLIELKAPPQAQTYQVQVLDQSFLRFNEGSMLSNTHKVPPGSAAGFELAAQARRFASNTYDVASVSRTEL
jgi:hypothetical protein